MFLESSLSYFLEKSYSGYLNEIDVCMNGIRQKNFFGIDSLYADFHVVEQWKNIKYKIEK